MRNFEIPSFIAEEIDAGALFVVNHSGGKDSQAMTVLLREAGIPADQILVVHAELPEVDWDGIPAHIEGTIPSNWEVLYTTATKTFFEMVERRFESRPDAPSWPSPKYRQCTSDLKRGPIDRCVRHWLKEHPEHSKRVVHCIGIRAEESTSRAKAKTWAKNNTESKAGRVVHNWLPIHDMLIGDVFSTIKNAGQEPHWAYAAGMSRLSCSFCIMANESDLKTAARLLPDLLNRYIELEERTGYTMSMSQKPLAEIVGAPIPVALNNDFAPALAA